MGVISSRYVASYRLLLYLYPRQHREMYGEEMVLLFRESLARETSRQQRLIYFGRTLKDTIAWAPRETLVAAETSYQVMPSYAKFSGALTSALLAPFFAIYAYHHLQLFVKYRWQMFNRPELTTSTLFSLVLPAAGLLLLATSVGWWFYTFYHGSKRPNIQQLWRSSLHDGLPYLFILSGLALMALL